MQHLLRRRVVDVRSGGNGWGNREWGRRGMKGGRRGGERRENRRGRDGYVERCCVACLTAERASVG